MRVFKEAGDENQLLGNVQQFDVVQGAKNKEPCCLPSVPPIKRIQLERNQKSS